MTIKRADLKTTSFKGIATGKRLDPVHPGMVLEHDFIAPLELTHYRVAKLAGIAQRRLDEICAGKRGITADTALRFARVFGTDPQTWMNLQTQYDLEVAERESHDDIERQVTPLAEYAMAA